MSLADLTGLKAAVADWLERADLAPRLDDFIALAEARMMREIRCGRMVTRASAEVAGAFCDPPDDFLAPRSMRRAGGGLLAFVTPEQMGELKGAQRGGGGELSAYALIGGTFEFFPAPEAPTEIALTYFARVPALSAASPSNWLLRDHPDLYLHAAVLEAALYLRDAELAAAAKGLFDEAKARLAAADAMDALAANLTPQPSAPAV